MESFINSVWSLTSQYLLYIEILAGVYLGFWTALFVMPLVPTFIERLTNKPNRLRSSNERDYPVSEFGFFTELPPGRVKIVERGGDFVRCLMNYEDHVFQGEVPNSSLRPNNDEYWEVLMSKEVETSPKPKDSHPIPWKGRTLLYWVIAVITLFAPPIWWLWKRYVFKVTGYVFTGIYPFQRVRTYPLEYFQKIKRGNGEEVVERIEDYSDHFRVADFQFPVRVPSADTADKIPVKVFVELMARVFNPYETAYWIDDWSTRLSAAAVDSITHFTRLRPYDDVISIRDAGKSREFSNEVVKIGNLNSENSVAGIGILIKQALIIDISPVRDTDGERLGEVARARVDRDSAVIRAEGRAAEIQKQSEAVKTNGHIGLAVLAAERNVRTAEAAGDKAIVVIGGGSDVDPIQAAILHELREQNKGYQPE